MARRGGETTSGPRRALAVAGLAAILPGTLTACGSEGGGRAAATTTTTAPDISATLPPEADEPRVGGTLDVAVARGVEDWNVLRTPMTTSTRWLATAVFEPLMRVSETGVPEPWLAESVTPDDTGTTWTITVREGVTFSDGGPLTAAAVKANLDARADSPLFAAAMAPLALVSVVDDRTVEVAMRTPWYGFDAFLSGPGGWQAAPSSVLDPEGDVVLDPVHDPVGTGPFTVAPRGDGDPGPPDGAVTFVRSDAYWGGPAPLDGVEVRVLPDARDRADALASGTVDLLLTSDPAGLVRFLGRPGYLQVEDLAATESAIELNTAAPPFDDPTLRRAAQLATDRAPIAELFTDGLGTPAAGPWIESQPWYDPDTANPEPDRREAAALVEAAGGEDPVEVRLLVEPTVEEVQLAQAVASQWEEVGFSVTLDTRPPEELADVRALGDYEAALVHTTAIADPDHLVGVWDGAAAEPIGEPSTNTTRVDDADLDEALDDLRAADEPAARTTAAGDVVRALNATGALVWLDHDVWALVGRDVVGGLGAPERFGFARVDAAPTWASLWLRS